MVSTRSRFKTFIVSLAGNLAVRVGVSFVVVIFLAVAAGWVKTYGWRDTLPAVVYLSCAINIFHVIPWMHQREMHQREMEDRERKEGR